MMDEQLTKAWITKSALTRGIRVVDAIICKNTTIAYKDDDFPYLEYLDSRCWKPSEEEAIAHVEGMRQRKIDGLQKQIDALKSLKIQVHTKEK